MLLVSCLSMQIVEGVWCSYLNAVVLRSDFMTHETTCIQIDVAASKTHKAEQFMKHIEHEISNTLEVLHSCDSLLCLQKKSLLFKANPYSAYQFSDPTGLCMGQSYVALRSASPVTYLCLTV